MVVSVFYKRLPPPCGLSCSFGYRRCFLQGLFQINRRVDPFKELPTYKDLISRWRCACKAIVAPFSGYFGRVEGLAWNNNGEDVSNSNDRTLMSAMDAFTASAGFASLLQDCFGATFLDVDAGITQSVPGDPRPSVTVEDISLAADAQQGVFGRVIVIRGCIFSPRYHKGLMDRLDKLEFAYSPPAKKRLIRISGF
jgi:hypothetical protein